MLGVVLVVEDEFDDELLELFDVLGFVGGVITTGFVGTVQKSVSIG